MLSLPFPSPDTVTIATQVFQSDRSMWRGTEVPFWKEWEGSLAWKVVSWWFLLPQGRKLLCDNHLVNLALQWATRPLGVGICFLCNPQSVCGFVCRGPSFYLISWEQCISRVCIPSLMCHPLYSISSTSYFVRLCSDITHKIRSVDLISIFKPNVDCWLISGSPLPFQHINICGLFLSFWLVHLFEWSCVFYACFVGVSGTVFDFVHPTVVKVGVNLGFVFCLTSGGTARSSTPSGAFFYQFQISYMHPRLCSSER